MIERLVVATHNAKKAGEMLTILSARFPTLQLLTLADLPAAEEPNESGSSYAENATIKAEAATKLTSDWCVADDAGLEVDAMNGEPGLWSKRFAGEGTPFSEKMAIILERLAGLREGERSARFRCCVALARVGYPTQVFEATCEGQIAEAPSGNGGFGYDPIFCLPELGCTMADLTPEQKHAISHRGKVLRALGDALQTLPN